MATYLSTELPTATTKLVILTNQTIFDETGPKSFRRSKMSALGKAEASLDP